MKLNDRIGYDVDHFRSLFKVKRVKDKKRLDFARNLPCAGCGKPAPNDPHHESLPGHGTMGGKAGDDRSLPLCRKCHSWRHQTGPSVYQLWKVDVEKLLGRINEVYAKIQVG